MSEDARDDDPTAGRGRFPEEDGGTEEPGESPAPPDPVADQIRMSQEQVERVNAWVQEHVSEPCPMCSEFNWGLRPQMLVHPFVNPKTGQMVDASYAVVPLECGACGFMATFSATALGLV